MKTLIAVIFIAIFIGIIFNNWIGPEIGWNPFKSPIRIIIKIIKFIFNTIFMLFRFIFQDLIYKNSGIYGSANFLTGYKKQKLISVFKDGLVIDGINRISLERSFSHVLVSAASGAGKTVKYVIPNILNLNNSAVIFDPSGELYKLTSGYLNTKGFNIKVINVTEVNQSLQYNPLYRANTHTEISKIADILIRTAYSNSSGNEEFWNNSAKNILTILIRCLKNEPVQYQNLANLRHLINNFGTDGSPLNNFIMRTADQHTFNEYKGFLTSDPKLRLNVISTARTALEKFSDPDLCQLTAGESLNFESLRTEKTAIFIQIPESEILYYQFFTKLLYQDLFRYSMKMPEAGQEMPIMFILDEFANTGKIDDFKTIITTARKRKVSFSIILQSYSQLEAEYGKETASTIINGGISGHIFLPGLDQGMCELLQRRLGKKTVLHQQRGSIGKKTEISKDLMTAEEIRTMPDEEGLFFHSNFKPVKLNVTPYYKNEELLRRTKIPAPILNQGAGIRLEYLNL